MREIGMLIPPNYPFAGDLFNVTMAGIHADGVMKDEEIYNIFDTVKILNRSHDVIITNRTGIAGIGFWVNQELEKRGRPPVDKRDPRVAKMFAWVEKQYEAGRVTSISPEEMMEQFTLHF
jgi:isopropylmalate/homocitrate/citramalate synthase